MLNHPTVSFATGTAVPTGTYQYPYCTGTAGIQVFRKILFGINTVSYNFKQADFRAVAAYN